MCQMEHSAAASRLCSGCPRCKEAAVAFVMGLYLSLAVQDVCMYICRQQCSCICSNACWDMDSVTPTFGVWALLKCGLITDHHVFQQQAAVKQRLIL
jgi:hypothetical protein